ncbi:unnamed protein product [Wuchereria bancrofti]|uniref:DUF4773 domain-containing protein n=1 Tax=Wuchereria bancrofti TaxID=6293 RepID=A0A3P7DR82_WUCBA|nr:unnamed protein product [Wuchereria bancrofti]
MINATNCQCITKNCACCMTLNVAKIGLNDFACVNITYISEDIVRNPPPYCLSLPFLKEYASICLRLRNLKFRKRNLDGCLELDAELYHVHVATIHLGCFTIPT